MLRAEGFPVRVWASAREFITEPPPAGGGCLIASVPMPEMTGLELQRELARAAPRLARGMVFVTGALLDEAARRQIAESGSTVVEKPFTPAQLLRAVDEALVAGGGGELAGGPRARQAGP